MDLLSLVVKSAKHESRTGSLFALFTTWANLYSREAASRAIQKLSDHACLAFLGAKQQAKERG